MLKLGVRCVIRAVSSAVLTDFGKVAYASLLLVLSCVLSPAFAQPFEGDGCTPEMKVKEGSGSVNDPYEIGELCQLQDISSSPRAHYELVADIDASRTENWNNGAGFKPIGSFGGSFVSTGDYVISSLTINRKAEEQVGLFSRLAVGGKIEGIMLDGSRTTGKLSSRVIGWLEQRCC